MSVTITSYALSMNATWPYVVVNHFDLRGQQLIELSGSSFVGTTHLVKRSERDQWEAWSVANQGWIPKDSFPPYMSFGISPTIKEGGQGAGLYSVENSTWLAPIWQTAPLLPQIVNQDTYYNALYGKVNDTRQLAMGPMASITAANLSDPNTVRVVYIMLLAFL